MAAIASAGDLLFKRIHSSNLIYNTCWEDPSCDRFLLDLKKDSRLVMITSAGCNALDYLLDDPERIHCVDVNYRQNAVLELKKALFAQADHDLLYRFFGDGKLSHYSGEIEKLLPQMSPRSAEYWRQNKRMFDGRGLRKSFYYYSSSGFLAWCVVRFLRSHPERKRLMDRFFACKDMAEQKEMYPEVERRFIGPFVRFLLKRRLTMYLLGVPTSQIHLFNQLYEEGIAGFIKYCLRKVFLELPISENYFYSLYYFGHYDRDRCPNYLKYEHFETLKHRHNRIETYSGTVEQFLIEHPGEYSHYVLLDHQDWLAQNNREALEREWKLVLKNSRSGTRILLRSAALEVNFFPDFVLSSVRFEQEKTAESHKRDRVGTYGSVYLAEVK